MIEMNVLMPMLSLGLLFVLVATRAYERSVTTAIYVFCVAVSLNCYAVCRPDIAWTVITAGAGISLIRTVINTESDRFLKRRK